MKELAVAIIILNIIGAVASLWFIGKPRKPFGPGSVLYSIVYSAVLVWLLAKAYL